MNSFFKPPKGKKSHIRRHVMGGGCSSIAGVEIANKGRQVNCHGTIITLPKYFTWGLFRHGDKTNKSPTRGGDLTPLGRRQIVSTSFQLEESLGEKIFKAHIVFSPVPRVQRSKNIHLAVLGYDSDPSEEIKELEWGPNNGHDNDAIVIKKLIERTVDDNVIIAFGHNGLFEYMADIIHPRIGGYTINPGEVFIVTQDGIEIISPRISA